METEICIGFVNVFLAGLIEDKIRGIVPEKKVIKRIAKLDDLLGDEQKNKKVILFTDRLFLGLHMENQAYKLYKMNGENKIVFVDNSTYPTHFALRLLNLGSAALIENACDEEALTEKLSVFFERGFYIPEPYKAEMRNGSFMDYEMYFKAPTQNEYRIFVLASMGYECKEIASKIGISFGTVANKLRSVRMRIGARNTADAVRILFKTMNYTNYEEDKYERSYEWNADGDKIVYPRRMYERSRKVARRTGIECRSIQRYENQYC